MLPFTRKLDETITVSSLQTNFLDFVAKWNTIVKYTSNKLIEVNSDCNEMNVDFIDDENNEDNKIDEDDEKGSDGGILKSDPKTIKFAKVNTELNKTSMSTMHHVCIQNFSLV